MVAAECKPSSVPPGILDEHGTLGGAIISLGLGLLQSSSDLPAGITCRASTFALRREAQSNPRIFGLAAGGVCLAIGVATNAVRSYRTISPLPSLSIGRCIFCGTVRRLGPDS